MDKPCCKNCARYKCGKCQLKSTSQYDWDYCQRWQKK